MVYTWTVICNEKPHGITKCRSAGTPAWYSAVQRKNCQKIHELTLHLSLFYITVLLLNQKKKPMSSVMCGRKLEDFLFCFCFLYKRIISKAWHEAGRLLSEKLHVSEGRCQSVKGLRVQGHWDIITVWLVPLGSLPVVVHDNLTGVAFHGGAEQTLRVWFWSKGKRPLLEFSPA